MSEKGHAVIVANFETLIAFIISLGAIYQPANPLLSLEALQLMLAEAKNLMSVVGAKKAAKTNAVNECRAKFARLRPLVTGVINLFEVCGASKAQIADLRYYVRKIYGKRVTPRAVDNPETTDVDESKKSHSAAQTSRSSLIAHLDRIISYLTVVGFYNVNEEEFQITALAAFSNELKDALNALSTANIDASFALGDRNQLFYRDEACLIKRANLVKTYLTTISHHTGFDFDFAAKLNFDKPSHV
jgi:hypothetical protein